MQKIWEKAREEKIFAIKNKGLYKFFGSVFQYHPRENYKTKVLGGRERKTRAVLFLITAVKAILTVFFSYLFGTITIPMGIHPAACAYLCASGRNSFFVCIGACLSCFGYSSLSAAYLAFNILILTTRGFLTNWRYDEKTKRKIISALIFSSFFGVANFLATGVFPSDKPSAADAINRGITSLLFIVSCVIITGLLCGLNIKNKNSKDEDMRTYYEISVCAAIFLIIYSQSNVLIGTYSVSFIISAVTVLFFAQSYGPLYGAGAGLLCGIACGNLLIFAPLLGLSGMAAGIFRKRGIAIPVALFNITGLAVTVYIAGLDPVKDIVSDLIAASMIYIPLNKFVPQRILSFGFYNDAYYKYSCKNDLNRDLEELSGAFSNLSDVFFKVSERLKYPEKNEIERMIENVCRQCCGKCSMQQMCYRKKIFEKNFTDEIIYNKLISGGVKKSDLPDKFSNGCVKIDSIVEQVNSLYCEMISENFKNNKTEILASEYSAMARIIKYTSQKSKKDMEKDRELTKAADSALREIDIKYSGLCAFGRRNKRIEVYNILPESIKFTSGQLSKYMSEKCGILLSEPEFINDPGGFTMILSRKRKIRLEYSQSARAKGMNEVNGDSVTFFENDEDYFYALISDGMGSGRQAALTSRLTSVFIEKLLTTGTHKAVTLELLNNLLLSKNDECFATVDLLEIDLLTGESSFIKAGAAPAYIVRSTKLYKIASSTPPAGIIQGFSAENTRFSLQSGDMILMLSDGIIQTFDENTWLCEMLAFENEDNPARLANRIINKAGKMNIREDDMSCAAIKIL